MNIAGKGPHALQNIIAVENSNVQGAYGATVAAALLFWHYLLTLDKEVAYFWKRGFAGGTVLFFANRYLTLAYSIHNAFLGPFIPSGPSCTVSEHLLYFESLFQCSQYLVWGAFSALRFYALRSQWPWATLVFVLSIAPFGVEFFKFGFIDIVFDPLLGCVDKGSESRQMSLTLSLVARICLIIGDVAVLVATWVATKDSRSEDVLHGFGRTTTLSEVIFKTGTIYFLAMTTMNALYPAAYVLTVIPSTSAGANPLSGLFQSTYGSLTAILVTQFLIALQEAVNATVHISVGSNAFGTWATPSNGMQSLIEFARADVDSLSGHGSIGADDSRSE